MSATTKTKNLGVTVPGPGDPDFATGSGTAAAELANAITTLDNSYGNVQELTAAGAITITSGVALLKAGSAAAITLAAPVAGLPGAGGNDGQYLTVIALDAYDYTVTTPANSINGSKHIATFGGAVGDSIELVAFNGVWYLNGTANGVTLS